jgi:hypothetical protein
MKANKNLFSSDSFKGSSCTTLNFIGNIFQEQVRRWKEREDELEKKDKKKANKPTKNGELNENKSGLDDMINKDNRLHVLFFQVHQKLGNGN